MQTHKPTQPILVPATPENGELCTTRYTKAVQAIVTSFTTSQRASKSSALYKCYHTSHDFTMMI